VICGCDDSLIDTDTVADHTGFPDDHSGPVINEEVAPNGGAGMDIDSRRTVRTFPNHPGNEGHFLPVKLMGWTVIRDGQAGILLN
jgi:hypothetical protein